MKKMTDLISKETKQLSSKKDTMNKNSKIRKTKYDNGFK